MKSGLNMYSTFFDFLFFLRLLDRKGLYQLEYILLQIMAHLVEL